VRHKKKRIKYSTEGIKSKGGSRIKGTDAGKERRKANL
jgi:hypothetical protein